MPRMKITTRIAGALGLVGTGALAAGGVAFVSSPASAAKAQTLQYTTKLTDLVPVPVAGQTSHASQPGDYVVITDQYLQKNKVVGTDDVHCMVVTAKSSLCFVAVSLPKGQLELQGIGPSGGTGHFTVAITGGTGAYANARGTATIISGPKNTGTETFHITS